MLMQFFQLVATLELPSLIYKCVTVYFGFSHRSAAPIQITASDGFLDSLSGAL